MNGHARELPAPGPLPDPICPGIEVLVHRRATELIPARPRRRVVTLSTVGGVAVAAICAVLVLVIGASSGSGLLSPRQAVAAVAASLDGDGILHWVRVGELVESPDQAERPGTLTEEEWTDLATGDSHIVATRTPQDGQTQTSRWWTTQGADWDEVVGRPGAELTIRRVPHHQAGLTAVEQVSLLLDHAAQGRAKIADGGEERGKPLVVVTERTDGVVRRVWITRDEHPRVVRSQTTVVSPNAPRPIVTTSTTTTWRVLPRTPQALADVEIPSHARRVP